MIQLQKEADVSEIHILAVLWQTPAFCHCSTGLPHSIHLLPLQKKQRRVLNNWKLLTNGLLIREKAKKKFALHPAVSSYFKEQASMYRSFGGWGVDRG